MNVEISEINYQQIKYISDSLFSEKKRYIKFFTPFDDKKNLIDKYLNKKNDKFLKINLKNEIIGLITLRGFDEGYEIPRFGIYIMNEYSNKGLGTIATKKFLKYCKSNLKINFLELKVNKKNYVAIKLYESIGFKVTKFTDEEQIMQVNLNDI